MRSFKKYLNPHKGFTMIEMLLSLSIFALLVSLVVALLSFLSAFHTDTHEEQDHIAILQMQWLLAQATSITIQDDALHFIYRQKPMYFEYHAKRLVKRDGYEIMMQDLEDVSFYQEGSCFGMHWKREKENKKALLACET